MTFLSVKRIWLVSLIKSVVLFVTARCMLRSAELLYRTWYFASCLSNLIVQILSVISFCFWKDLDLKTTFKVFSKIFLLTSLLCTLLCRVHISWLMCQGEGNCCILIWFHTWFLVLHLEYTVEAQYWDWS